MRSTELKPVFVDFIPLQLEQRHLYISMKYGTAVHLCACGCGQNVVTPLNPAGWELRYKGKVTLRPSIGNYEFPCHSHYFITENKIEWLPSEIESNMKKKKKRKRRFKFTSKFPFLSFW